MREMQFAHAGEHHLLGLGIVVEMDRGVFLGDLVKRAGKLGFVAASLGSDGETDHRRGIADRRQLHVAQRHARVQVFALGDRHDVAGTCFVDRGRIVGLHAQQRCES